MSDQTNFTPKKFAVVGAGPVGCIVAAFLAKRGYEVTLCDIVPELLEPVTKEPGITIEGSESLQSTVTRTTRSVDELGQYEPDVVFITVKANATPLIASAVEGFLRDGMYVISWQNGIDTELAMAQSLGKKPVMRAVVNWGCGLAAPGHVKMPFHHPPHYIQALDPASVPAADAIAKVLTECGLETQNTEKIVSMVWRKSVLNACMNPVCAVTGFTMSQAMSDPIVFGIVDNLIKEGVKIARANEIELGWDFYPHAIEYMSNAGNHKPSMLMDIENKRRTEVDFINGKFIHYGKQAEIPTPYNSTIYGLVKAIEP
jgi:2-dehydropantoate 2-reductase